MKYPMETALTEEFDFCPAELGEKGTSLRSPTNILSSSWLVESTPLLLLLLVAPSQGGIARGATQERTDGDTFFAHSSLSLSLSLDGHFLLLLPPMIMMSLVRPSAFLIIDFQRRNREHGNVGDRGRKLGLFLDKLYPPWRRKKKRGGGGVKMLAQIGVF